PSHPRSVTLRAVVRLDVSSPARGRDRSSSFVSRPECPRLRRRTSDQPLAALGLLADRADQPGNILHWKLYHPSTRRLVKPDRSQPGKQGIICACYKTQAWEVSKTSQAWVLEREFYGANKISDRLVFTS